MTTTTLLSTAEIVRVRHLLRAGFRYPQIARETGWSVWTIAKIASHPGFHRLLNDDSDLEDAEAIPDDAPPEFVATNLARCRSCGAMNYVAPCLTCQTRQERATQEKKIKAFAQIYEPPTETRS